jgi:hypothetical protein
MQTPFRKTPTRLLAVMLVALGAATTAQALPLQGQITLRPLTPQDIKDYKLTGLQGASGLSTVGVGQPAYLEALINNAIPDADVTNVTWTLTDKPGSSVAALDASPLGTNVPTYKMADRFNNSGAPVYKVAGRTLLRPDVTGQYTVSVAIQTASNGSTNLTQVVTAGTYMGLNTCALCHSGGLIADDIVHPWSQTPHATFFARQIDGGTDPATSHYGKNCISCHTVGYDANTNAVNGGFDDVAKQLGWTFPTNLVPGNWASIQKNYPALANVANIQCENCHGPGSQHAFSLGNTNLISKSYIAGDCAQCHDSKPNHVRSAEWNNSLHARVTRSPSGTANRAQCVRCHTAPGIATYLGTGQLYISNVVYEAITCQACHDPHDDSKPHQLRAGPVTTLNCGVTVTNAGSGAFCMNCHQSRTGSVTNSIEKYPLGQPTWAGGSSFGPHDNPAADMLLGINGWTYGKDIPSSAHRYAISNTCVTCHMQTVASTDPAFTKAGGHTWNMSYQSVTNGVTNTVDMVGVCVQCHGPIDSFDIVRGDLNGDGLLEGVQTEVQKLLDKLSTLMPSSATNASGNYVADGKVKTSLSVKPNWQSKFLKAAWNWQLVSYDLSKGVHNAPYAVGLLKASIADLTGDANNDGLPDAWQIQYFGSANDPKAAPNATPAGDGIPNWVKYSLGLDPTVAGMAVPGGVVYANGKGLVSPPDPGGTNTVAIYTAAEVTFATETGKTYQLEGSASLSAGWQPIGSPIVGDGLTHSYVTPTRTGVQQFFRVVHTP